MRYLYHPHLRKADRLKIKTLPLKDRTAKKTTFQSNFNLTQIENPNTDRILKMTTFLTLMVYHYAP